MNTLKNINPVKVEKSTIVNLEKGKLPPQSIDLEEAIIGGLLIDSKASDDLFQVFSSEEVFYKDSHKIIFKAIKVLLEKSFPVDLLTVSQQLKSTRELELVGGDYYLIQLTQKISSSAHIDYHARIVLQNYMKRKLIQVASDAISLAYDVDTDIFDLLDRIDIETSSLNDVISKGKVEMTFSDALSQVVKNVEILSSAGGAITGIDTGFTKLNKHFGGWQLTDFVVIGARPGMGKTAFTINTMIAGAKSGSGVGFISLEMSTVQLATRSVAVNSNYHLNQLTRNGFEKPEYFQGLMRITHEMKSLPIYIDDRPSLTIGEIKRKARLWKRKFDIKELIVDYVQLAGGEDNEQDRVRVSKISRGLKAIAKELNIVVIGLAQVGRSAETSGGAKRPHLHHLKESGTIEEDADVVAFLYRPAYYGFDVDHEVIPEDCNTEFIIEKNRHGGVGTFGLYYDANKTKFTDNNSDFSYVNQEVKPEFKGDVNDVFDTGPVELDNDIPDWLK